MQRTGRKIVVVAMVLGIASCAPVGGVPRQTAGESPLLTSLQITPAADQVTFLLQVTNTAGVPIELNFTSGQSAEFIVQRGDERIWRWSDDQMFTQALRSERLGPGESVSYDAQWRPPPGLAGEFTGVGVLTARDHRVEQAARFTLP